MWRHFARGLRKLIYRKTADQDLADEVRDYLEQATAALEATGLPPAAARRVAQLQNGNPTLIQEQVRSSGWEHLFETLLADLRFAARQLRLNPGFTLVSVITLALGIGASTAIFSVLNPILFEPLPYPQAGRVMVLEETRNNRPPRLPTFATFHGLAAANHTFDALAVFKPWQPTMVGDDQPERFDGQRVSPGYFRSLGIVPSLGRGFEPADDYFHGPNVVVLSDSLWRRRFAANRAIIGSQVTLDDTLFTVIGVMPGSFENVLAPTAELWAPLQYNPALPADGREWGHHLRMVGRLRPEVNATQAASELKAVLQPFAATYAQAYACCGGAPDAMTVTRLQDEITRGVRPSLLAILGAVILLLLIACVNVTNLLLARGARRRAEFAMRTALGAGRLRLLRQMLAESLMLATIGGSLGILVAQLGVRLLVTLSPPGLPRVSAVAVDTAVFAFAFGMTTLVGLLVGLVPALQASQTDPQTALRQNSRTTAGGHQFTRRLLVVSEVALACILLIGAGLLLRSLQHLFAIDPGFDATHLLTLQVQESGRRFNDDNARARFFDRALDAVRQVPGVSAAALTSQLPLSDDDAFYGMQIESLPAEPPEGLLQYAVSASYFDTMKIPLRRGRLLDERDGAAAPASR